VRLEFLEDRDLSHGSGRNTFILVLKFDLFEGDDAVGASILGSEDNTVSALSQPFHFLILVL